MRSNQSAARSARRAGQRGKQAMQQPVVMMSLDDYEALEETAYLLRRPGRTPNACSVPWPH
ncbi:MAG: hypothetical protein LBV49_08745 [Azonexus sp.]|jgi:hypothetical protein|nr:hypothetical protein [Azonexus sp.]